MTIQSLNAWPPKEPEHILVKMPNWVGDLVMATPILEDLCHHWKNAEITALCQAHLAPLLEHNPHLDAVLTYKKPNSWLHRQQHFDIIEMIRKGKYDLGVLLTNSFSSAWWFWRGRIPYRIGYGSYCRNFLLSKAVPFPPDIEKQHQIVTYKMLLQPLGIPLSQSQPRLYLTAEEKQRAQMVLGESAIVHAQHRVIGINPGASYGSAKCWPPERFEELTRRLLEEPDVYVLYFGDNRTLPLVEAIVKNFKNRVINLAGKTTLRELAALMQECSLLITNDSGPMHMAAALGVPLIALFGSTNPIKTGPKPQGEVLYHKTPCSPCYRRRCPHDFQCMHSITVDEVITLTHKLLSYERK